MAVALQQRCQCRRPIELRVTDELATAATFGFLKPVILLPAVWPQWSHDELAAVLAHEVAHIRRGDYLLRLIAQLSAAVHFYHPLVRASVRYLAADQEMAADRLASGLRPNKQVYIRGLAKLALRYHDSFQDDRAWSSVSVMPKSSDFLARRLEMLRTKDGSTNGRVGKVISCCATGAVVLIALAATLLRAPAASTEKTTQDSAAPAQAAAATVNSANAENSASQNQPTETLFGREPFDVSIIPHADDGAFLIRVAALLRNHQLQPHVDEFNQDLAASLRNLTKLPDVFIDLRQIEWIAGSTTASVKANPKITKECPGKNVSMFGSSGVVIRMARAGNWQETILKHVPGSTLETFEGKTYLQTPPILALGPGPGLRFRFPDDKTIIIAGGFKPEEAATSNKIFFESHLVNPYAWADAWRAADGGLITVVVDNAKIGWPALLEKIKDCPEFARPLFEQVHYYAIGCDWTEQNDQAGIQIHATCADQDAVGKLHLAASIVLNKWPELFEDHDEDYAKYSDRIFQVFSSLKIQPSPDRGNQHFLHATTEVAVEKQELIGLIASILNVPLEPASTPTSDPAKP
jgi:hypothetical protein